MSTKTQRVNDQIRVPRIHLIGNEGKDLGVVATQEALEMARQQNLDLVEVSPNARPPVVRVMDYGAYRYRLEKQASKQRKHQKKIEIKGIRIGMRISEHDFEHKVRQAQTFLQEGHKIKLELVMRGREQAPQLRGRALDKINTFIRILGPGVIREQDITKLGNRLTMMLGLSKQALQQVQQTNAKTQDTSSQR
ncbi:MAG: translation initiation factor IF-3 [Parcubacteria group bacterium]